MKKTTVEKHFDKVAGGYDSGKDKYSFYYQNLKKLLSSLIKKDSIVFEIGCGTGDLISYLKPKVGWGMDISSQMIKKAKTKHRLEKNLIFSTSWPKKKDIFASRDGRSEYIFMSDVIEHLENPKETFLKVSRLMKKDTRFVITMANPIWEPMLLIWEWLGWKMPEGKHKRLWKSEIENILREAGLKIEKHDYKLLIPVEIPVITKLLNTYLEKILKRFAFIEYFVVTKE